MAYNKDDLGDRMKECYENRTRQFLPRRTNTIIRLDGKAFHTFTKKFARPFSDDLIHLMDQTAIALCEEVQGVKFAYVQSDEISLLLQDYETPQTDAWFDGNIQKITSVSASIATAAFNAEYLTKHVLALNMPIAQKRLARFDSRVFTIPQLGEVENYFIWRQNDASRNSVSMVAQSLYSHKELQNKGQQELQELIFQKGINWNNYPINYKRGRVIAKHLIETKPGVLRHKWLIESIPMFTQERAYIEDLVKGKGVLRR